MSSRIQLSTGSLPSLALDRLAASRPFIDRIDLVVPTAHDYVFTPLKTTYTTAQFTLSELYTFASSLEAPFTAVPVQEDAEETWCIDPRGVLTLSVPKTLYEQLGIVGKKLPFKGCPERYAIHVPPKRASTVGLQARRRDALAIWDRTRDTAGLGRWRVAYTGASPPAETHAVHDVSPRVRRETDVYVPRIGVLTPPNGEPSEAHDERLGALFEWIGMVCLGAQRLRGNDRVDPYVAVYDPPAPASIGEVTHLHWQGLLDGAFVRSVIEAAILLVSSSDTFIAITLHANRVAPVSYIPESLTKEAPLRVPGREAEDTVCVILSESTWAMGQSIGKWNARWG